MQCYYPIRAFQVKTGTPLFFSPQKNATAIDIPCGKCIGCRLNQAQQWAIRSHHEAKCWPKNTFATLTYNDEQLPADLNLQPQHFTLFLKRLREHQQRKHNNKIRYMMCGEYGDLYSRPHYHAIIYNFEPDDLQHYKDTKAGHPVYTSETMDKLWRMGTTYWGNATYESAGYIARYVTKVFSNTKHTEIIDVETGEIIQRVTPYADRSTHPGLGAEWIRKYGKTDAYSHDRIILDGKKLPVPRYYSKIQEREAPLYYHETKQKRRENADTKDNQLYETEREATSNPWVDHKRLATHEQVKKAQIKSLRRHDDV
ncbi:MAG: replication initiator protein [Microvirus sp.]|nr:MAG: replication initiator protein [Microvirus sp.]